MTTPDGSDLELAIEAQERLRGVVPDQIVDSAIAALRLQLDGVRQSRERRRQATILFADVRGFTELSDRLDAEHVADVMNRLWERLDAVIAAHGGRVDKHIGDAVMAVWGTDAVREDDAERAVRAALDLQAVLMEYWEDADLSVEMRVGVNTGSVLLGRVGTATGEFTAMGDAVNVASRLERVAPSGGVLISHDTYRHVRGVFDVQAPVALTLKGKPEPVLTYLVERAKPRAFRMATRGVEGVETTTIGRAADLERLCTQFEACAVDAGARRVLVVGEAGVGKSRLLYEFRNWLDLRPERIYFFMGRAAQGQERVALGLLRDVIASRLDILPSDDPVTVREKLRQGFAASMTANEADVVGHWLGFGLERSEAVTRIIGSSEVGTIGRVYLFHWLAGFTRDSPAVLLLEDVHWADDETLEVVDELVPREDLHLLVVALVRPGFFDRRPAWADAVPRGARIDLHPLDTVSCRQLVLEVLKHVADVPEPLLALIARHADGNPFYVEELAKMMIDDGVVAVSGSDDEPWHVDLERLDEVAVPATLSGVLQARLDVLPDSERAMLQHASVVGRVFWDRAVTALSPTGEPSDADIESARRRELLHSTLRSTFAECREFAFKHALLRDVTYETVLLRERAWLHQRAAEWIEQAAGARVTEHHEMIARHLELAGELDASTNHLWRSADVATKSGHHAAAVRNLQRAFELWAMGSIEPPADAYAVLGKSLRVVGEFDEAAVVLARGLAALPAGSVAAASLYYEASAVAAVQGDHEREGVMLDSARACVESADLMTRTLLEIGCAFWHMSCGRLGDSRLAAGRGVDLATELGDPRVSGLAASTYAMAAANDGELELALQYAERGRAHAEMSGDLYTLATAAGHLAVAHHLLGDEGATEHYQHAVRAYEHSRQVFVRLGARPSAAYTLVNLAQVNIRLGRDTAAGEHLRRGLSEGLAAGSSNLVLCLQVEADRRIAVGDVAGGVALLGGLRRHPLFHEGDELESKRILSRVALPGDEVERMLDAGSAIDLDAVVHEMLIPRETIGPGA